MKRLLMLCGLLALTLSPAPAALALDHTTNAGETEHYMSANGTPPTTTYANYINEGQVIAEGTASGNSETIALEVTNDFINRAAGTLSANGSSIGHAGFGIQVGGNFSNSGSGSISANGTSTAISKFGFGIQVVGNFSNSGSGVISANGSTSDGTGFGISVGGNFSNSGSGAISANGSGTSGGSASGIYVYGNFSNSGSGPVNLLAHAEVGGSRGYGLNIGSGGLTNTGQMTLAGASHNGGEAFSVFLLGTGGNNGNAAFESGSRLYLAEGGNIIFNTNTNLQTTAIGSGARLFSLAATVNSGNTTSHVKFIDRADGIYGPDGNLVGTAGEGGFVTADNGVYRYEHVVNPGNGSSNYNAAAYSVSVTRLADASAVTGGAAGSLLAGLENYWRGTELYTPLNEANITRLDDADIGWLYLLAEVENAPNVQAAGQELFRQASPQAATQSILALSRGQRLLSELFTRELLDDLPDLSVIICSLPTDLDEPMGLETPTAYNYDPSFNLWAAPLYHGGSQNGDASHTALDQDFAGFNAGVTWWDEAGYWGKYSLGAAVNYLHGKFEGDDYSARTNGFGFSLGASVRFEPGGEWNPRLALYGGLMFHQMEQSRTVGDLALGNGVYTSSPQARVWNIGLSLDNYFLLDHGLILRPRLALDYARTSLDAYTESGPGNGGLELDVKADAYHSLRGDLGLTLLWMATDAVVLEASADWFHEFADSRAVLTGTPVFAPDLIFQTEGLDPGRNSGSAGLGLTWQASDMIEFKLNYACHFGAGYLGNEIGGFVRVTF